MKRPPAGLRSRALVAALLIAAAGCSSIVAEEPPVQDSLLVEALVDLHLAEARAARVPPSEAAPIPRDALLSRHGLDAERFRAAMAYYAERPEAFYDLYDLVVVRLIDEARTAPLSADP